MTLKRCPSGGVVKGFQTDCNLAGPLGDLTGRGDKSSGKVVHKDRTGPLGDLTGKGDQSSGKVVHKDRNGPLRDLTGRGDQPSGKVCCCQVQNRDNQHRITTRGRTGVFSSWATGIVRIHITL